jgi:ATP-dependent Clp protease ATP-binding subunit ClpC
VGWISRFGARWRGRARSKVDLDALALGQFTSAAKRTLRLAEQGSIRSHHSYLGSEHVVLALLQQRGTFASETLSRLPVSESDVRAVIEGVLGRSQRIEIQQIIPTARVKKIIELALREARASGSIHVRTDHLLLGVLIEGEGIGAHVLQDRGATLSWVRRTLPVVTQEGRINEPVDP